MKIKPFYKLKEIMSLIGYKSLPGTSAFMDRLGVPHKIIGKNTKVWFLSDIQTFAPELFSSMCESVGLQNIVARNERDDEEEDEGVSVNQFRQ